MTGNGYSRSTQARPASAMTRRCDPAASWRDFYGYKAIDQPAQKHIRHDSQNEGDDKRLARIDEVQLDKLISTSSTTATIKTPPMLFQPSLIHALARHGTNGPEKRRQMSFDVAQPGQRGQDRRHGRLHIQSELHRSADPTDKIAAEAKPHVIHVSHRLREQGERQSALVMMPTDRTTPAQASRIDIINDGRARRNG